MKKYGKLISLITVHRECLLENILREAKILTYFFIYPYPVKLYFGIYLLLLSAIQRKSENLTRTISNQIENT